MVGRNAPCPCGSGKKYKKCCGIQNVITLGHIVDRELEEIQKDIIQYAVTHYETFIDNCIEEHDVEQDEIPEELQDIFHFYSILYIVTTEEMENGKTILVDFVDRFLQKHKRPQIRDVVNTWSDAKPSLLLVVDREEKNNYLTVKDFFTKEMMTVVVPSDSNEIGEGQLLLTILLHAGNNKHMTFAVGLDLPSEKTEKVTNQIYNLYDNSGLDPEVFVSSNFLNLIRQFIFSTIEITTADLEWGTKQQLEVAETLELEIPLYFFVDEMTSLAIGLWKKFCDRKNPRIQKPDLYVASMIYLLDQFFPFGQGLTQAQIAADFDLPSNSISAKYNELRNLLIIDLDELSREFYDEFDDEYGDDDIELDLGPDDLF